MAHSLSGIHKFNIVDSCCDDVLFVNLAHLVERFNCKRPIQCLASSKILKIIDPPPPHCPASVYPPPLVRGRTHSLGGEGGRGVNIFEDARHCSVVYIRKYFVGSPDVSLLLQIAQVCLLTHTKTLSHNIFLPYRTRMQI